MFHTAVMGFLDDQERRAFADRVATAGATWITNEFPGVVPGVADTGLAAPDGAHDGFVLALDGRAVALADPHGAWLRWMPEARATPTSS